MGICGSGRGAWVAAALALLAVPGGAEARSTPPPGAPYVAMGSSFASGPGVTTMAAGATARCRQSDDNYARQLARKRGLNLVDVSCAGATTAHLLSGWDDLPPQIDAVTADTKLVTVTAGGNDVWYITGLALATCRAKSVAQPGGVSRCPADRVATGADWKAMEGRLTAIAREVRRRAPDATLIFVDYPAVVPAGRGCPVVPLPEGDLARARATAARLARVTARVAKRSGAGLLKAGFSKDRHACAATPWTAGFAPSEGVPYPPGAFHPNLAGMTALAAELDRMLR